MDQTIVARATRNAVCAAVLSTFARGDKDFNFLSSQSRIVFCANTLLERKEALVPFECDVLGHLIVTVSSWSSGARRVEECKG